MQLSITEIHLRRTESRASLLCLQPLGLNPPPSVFQARRPGNVGKACMWRGSSQQTGLRGDFAAFEMIATSHIIMSRFHRL